MSRVLIHHRDFGRLSHEVGCRLLLYLIHRGDYPREIMEDFHKHPHHSHTDTAKRCLFQFDITPALTAVQRLSALLIYSSIDREVSLQDVERYAVALPHSERLIVRRPHDVLPIGLDRQVKEWRLRSVVTETTSRTPRTNHPTSV